jgi:hypothetical protein
VCLRRWSCRLQQIRSSWQEHPNNNNAVMRLTPECRDLLDKMFDTNQVGGWNRLFDTIFDQVGGGDQQDLRRHRICSQGYTARVGYGCAEGGRASGGTPC